MEINVDVLLCGCNTRCRHCYVNGGPGPMMPFADAMLCIQKLEEMGRYLPQGTSFTLDHEPMNHPQITEILKAACANRFCTNYHHGMTTGIGLMSRSDRERVVRAYLDCGCQNFGITLHGAKNHHDQIVRRKGAQEKSIAAAKFLQDQGAEVEVSLMLNRFFAEDAKQITQVLQKLGTKRIYLAIPIFVPHASCMDFEPYRASLDTWDALKEWLPQWGQDPEAMEREGRLHTAGTALARLQETKDLRELFCQQQNELYLTLHPDGRLYVGNSGSETQCLGDLKSLSAQKTAKIIQGLPGNRDYTAYYALDQLPQREALMEALTQLPQRELYGDFESVLYRGLAQLGVPARRCAAEPRVR